MSHNVKPTHQVSFLTVDSFWVELSIDGPIQMGRFLSCKNWKGEVGHTHTLSPLGIIYGAVQDNHRPDKVEAGRLAGGLEVRRLIWSSGGNDTVESGGAAGSHSNGSGLLSLSPLWSLERRVVLCQALHA